MNDVIKVADFGLTEDVYAAEYFRKSKSDSGSDEKVPLRWMAPESINSDLYTEKTDVVSKSPIIMHITNNYYVSLYSGHLE